MGTLTGAVKENGAQRFTPDMMVIPGELAQGHELVLSGAGFVTVLNRFRIDRRCIHARVSVFIDPSVPNHGPEAPTDMLRGLPNPGSPLMAIWLTTSAGDTVVPMLGIVRVGERPDDMAYERSVMRRAEKVGIEAFDHDLPAGTTEAEILALIDRLNADPKIHGILVQLPLPGIADATALIDRIDPRKDVDGFHPQNVGHLALRQFGLRPCTPRGIMTLLAHTDRPVRGRNATIVGVSNHVGRPMALELLIAGCTVTSCHKFTPHEVLEARVRDADVLVVAVGRPGIVPGEWVKPGAVVIDVGINRLDDGRLVGDVGYEAAAQRASWITPVPGGVGPMTVATLMQNTIEAVEALERHG